jgi:hypothetical protein
VIKRIEDLHAHFRLCKAWRLTQPLMMAFVIV